jgi:putative transposase
VKYRHKVLVGDVEKRLKEMLHHIADVNDFSIVTMETDQDHIHLLIDCSPQHYIPNIMKAMKGNTARFLFKEFPHLKNKRWGGHLWNPSYFVATISENIQQQVLEYIESQKVRSRRGKTNAPSI